MSVLQQQPLHGQTLRRWSSNNRTSSDSDNLLIVKTALQERALLQTHLMWSSVGVPVGNGIVVACLQLHVLHTLTIGVLEGIGCLVPEIWAGNVCKEDAIWNHCRNTYPGTHSNTMPREALWHPWNGKLTARNPQTWIAHRLGVLVQVHRQLRARKLGTLHK